MIICVKAFKIEAGRDADVDTLGIMYVSTPNQFNEALRVYANPPRFLAFKDECGKDLGNRGRARTLLLSSIREAVLRQLSRFGSQGNMTAELAQVTGVPAKELATILNMLYADGGIQCSDGIWTLAKE